MSLTVFKQRPLYDFPYLVSDFSRVLISPVPLGPAVPLVPDHVSFDFFAVFLSDNRLGFACFTSLFFFSRCFDLTIFFFFFHLFGNLSLPATSCCEKICCIPY